MIFDAASRLPAPLSPGATIGILGGGQLGRMLAMAAARLGLRCHVYTDEFENVPVATAAHLARSVTVLPSPYALEIAQDRLREKQFIASLAIPVADFAEVNDAASLQTALNCVGRPSILKTRRLGYDGKGQARVSHDTDALSAFTSLAQQPAVLERFVPFEHEISVLLVRGRAADASNHIVDFAYDIPLNRHKNGILDRSTIPAPLPAAHHDAALKIAETIADALDYIGVLAVEMFHLGGENGGLDALVVNEIAPRVHNSGHWTMDACRVDQFENHIRAIAGWPLATTERHSDAEMINLIGADAAQWHDYLTRPDTTLHLYGKNEARSGRKMGHVNRLSPKDSRGTP